MTETKTQNEAPRFGKIERLPVLWSGTWGESRFSVNDGMLEDMVTRYERYNHRYSPKLRLDHNPDGSDLKGPSSGTVHLYLDDAELPDIHGNMQTRKAIFMDASNIPEEVAKEIENKRWDERSPAILPLPNRDDIALEDRNELYIGAVALLGVDPPALPSPYKTSDHLKFADFANENRAQQVGFDSLRTSSCVVLLSDRSVKLADSTESANELSYESQNFTRYMQDGSTIDVSLRKSDYNKEGTVNVNVSLPAEGKSVDEIVKAINSWITELLPQQIKLADGIDATQILHALHASGSALLTNTDSADVMSLARHASQQVHDTQENSMSDQAKTELEARLEQENAELKAKLDENATKHEVLVTDLKSTLSNQQTSLSDLTTKVELLLNDNKVLRDQDVANARVKAELDLKKEIMDAGLVGETAELALDDGFIKSVVQISSSAAGEVKLSDGKAVNLKDAILGLLKSVPKPVEATAEASEEKLHAGNATKEHNDERTYAVNFDKPEAKLAADALLSRWEEV